MHPLNLVLNLLTAISCVQFGYLQDNNSTVKIPEIAHFIAQRIMQLCQCQYSDRYIIDGQLFCTSESDVIYQAQLLSTAGITAQEIRNITQQWVLSRPTIMIADLSYQVDPGCSVVVQELGETLCSSVPINTQSEVNTAIVVSVVIVVSVLLLLFVGLITAFLCYLHKKKSKSLSLK